MAFLRDAPIRTKLTVIIMAISSAALVLASTAFVAQDVYSHRSKLVEDLEIISRIVGQNSSAALVFDDTESAKEHLAALHASEQVVRAALFDTDQQVFASYRRADTEGELSEAVFQPGGSDISGNRAYVYTPVLLEGELIGTVFVESDLSAIDAKLNRNLLVLAAVLLGSLMIAYLLSSRLQRLISAPIRELARLTSAVSREGDYSVRGTKGGDDEIGQLTDGFNHMLGQVELRDAELRVAKEHAEQANQTKSAFLANMSHELRTPMNAILGYSEMLMEDATDAGHDDYVSDLKNINTAGKHLLMLINDVLDLSKIEAGRIELLMENFELEDLLNEITSMAQPLVEKNGNELSVDIAPELITLRGDVTRLRQVLFNLISNASKFTDRGKITLKASRVKDSDGEFIQLDVGDTGIGMTPEQLDRIREFQPFTQADASTTRKFGGTGLGLVITKRFAELMGGDLTVESEAGVGSTFTIRLPLVAATEDETGTGPAKESSADVAPEPTEPTEPAEPAADGRKGSILVIDDDPATREIISRLLSPEGFKVSTAEGGKEGLRMAAELNPAVITLDVNMPDLSGWDVLAALKSDDALRDIPVILLTMVDDRSKGIALGAAEYLTKPIDREQLARVLDRFRYAEPPNTVLMVDDDPVILEHLGRTIRKIGWNVVQAENGRVALEALEREVPTLILLDLIMPELDGFGFLRELRSRKEWTDIPVVVLTGADLSAAERSELDGQVDKLMQKGAYSRSELEAEVRALVSNCTSRPSRGSGTKS